MSHQDVLLGNDEPVEILGARDNTQDPASPVYFNAATVQFTVFDDKGVEVAGQAWPAPMAYIPLSNGDYRGTLSKDAQLTEDKRYDAVMTVDAGPGFFGKWTLVLRAKVRRA